MQGRLFGEEERENPFATYSKFFLAHPTTQNCN